MKHTKILFLIILILLSLGIASCIPGGGQPAQGWAGTVFYDGKLYAGTMDGSVVAVNPETRSIEWSYAISTPSKGMSCGGGGSSPTAIYGTPIASDELVYVAAYSGKAYGLNGATGRDRWIYPKEGYIGPIVANLVAKGDTIFLSSSDGKVYALDTTYGEEKWETEQPLNEKLWTTPAIEGDTIYLSTFDGFIYALSVEDGSLLRWSFKADAGFVSSPAVHQNTIFVGAFDNNLYAIEIGGSEPVWKFSGDSWFWATPVVKDGIVYAGCLDGKIYAINAETGDLEWDFDTGSSIVSSPVWDGDLLIVASETGDLYVFNTKSKPENKAMTPVKTISINAVIKASLCVQDSIVYVRAQNNYLYAVDIDAGWVSWELSLSIKEES